MKFLRQLAAVLIVVAAVTALGIAWEHSSAARLITPPPPPGAALRGPANVPAGKLPKNLPPGTRVDIGPGGRRVIVRAAPVREPEPLFDFSDSQNVIHTTEIEALVMAGVIALSAIRRQRRRAQRAAWAPAPAPAPANGLTFTVSPGKITGFLGPHGAGNRDG